MIWLLLCVLADVTVGQTTTGDPELYVVVEDGEIAELRLQSGERLLWKRPPPGRMGISKPKGKTVPARLLGYPFYAVKPFRDGIVVAFSHWLWIFNRSDGKTLLSEGVPEMGFGNLMFDRAKVTIHYKGGPSCTFDATDNRFLLGCGTRLVDCTSSGIVVFDSEPYRVRALWMVPDVKPLDADGAWHLDVGETKITIRPVR